MRGEKHTHRYYIFHILGSSPHARGKVVDDYDFLVALRIIPACAGKSIILYLHKNIAWDHPRMRGEKTNREQKHNCYQGSSPHARGKDPFV